MPAPARSQQHVAGVSVVVDGTEVDPKFRDALVEVRVRDTLALPDSAILRIGDPTGEIVDDALTAFGIGKDLEIKVSPPSDTAKVRIFKGQVVSLEPDFGKKGAEIVIRGLDKAHTLQRERKVRTFQQVSASDIVKKVAGEAGLSADAQSTSVVHEFFQQSGETDWELIARLARDHGCRCSVDDGKLVFKNAETSEGRDGRPEVAGDPDELPAARLRRPAGARTVNVRRLGPQGQEGDHRQRGDAGPREPAPDSSAAPSAGFGSTHDAGRRPRAHHHRGGRRARHELAQRRADGYVEAEGVAVGNPEIRAGCKVKIEGVGRSFGGTYIVSSSTHLYRGGKGYTTSFVISGRSERGLLDLMHPPREARLESRPRGRHRDQQQRPDQMGRVKVKFPLAQRVRRRAPGRASPRSPPATRAG